MKYSSLKAKMFKVTCASGLNAYSVIIMDNGTLNSHKKANEPDFIIAD